ncbi:metallophosphoesterase [Massilia sp. TS11]|uniref:metallophosphoesterase family protein n=1 Tax=Massilia sp. TS11 TaxID=2908003 RepID=UPI001EDB90CD|nr:metallophosphoesterase family protein [Massilia sp. TS11]MCG2583163.1 metallophosphatase family protein [Massilia sp. TS11]
MLLAILTDLHSNREATEAVLDHALAQKADAFAFLGDLVGYGADPAWVVDTVMDYARRGAYVVMGNHDQAVAEADRPGMTPAAREAVSWTRNQLSPAQLDFLRTLPLQREMGDIQFVHANAFSPATWDYIDGALEATRSMNATRHMLTFCGHVHTPALYHMTMTGKTGIFTPQVDESIPLSRQRRWLAIPGAVGQPRDGNPAAAYALFDTRAYELRFHRVPYEAERAASKIRAAGLPPALAQRLLTGD